uniref:Glutathione transferase n=1 Tax=Alexandrium catenella TaxID=2925 RepID=A0A7S1MGU6_ALECA
MERVCEVFSRFDKAGTGTVSQEVLGGVLQKLGVDDASLLAEGSPHAVDGRVRYKEFLSSLCTETGDAPAQKPIFFDMIHSNNAARIRLWLALKEGMAERVETRMVTYPDLKTEAFLKVNPLGKVPALIRSDGVTVFESPVILEYLEEKYWSASPSFKPQSPEGRQLMNLMLRIHDLYIASPNCTAPGHSHSQGAMYLSYGFHGPARGMDLKTRADKIAEIWKQLTWMNQHIVGPYLCGGQLTLADLTWFPTTIFMEFMLPRVFGWPDVFREHEGPFPALARWWCKLSEEAAFKKVRQDIYGYWEEMEGKGQFQHIIDEVAADKDGLKFKYP